MKHVKAMVQQGNAYRLQCANQVAWKSAAQNSHWHYPTPAAPKTFWSHLTNLNLFSLVTADAYTVNYVRAMTSKCAEDHSHYKLHCKGKRGLP